jgi:predicted TIM-barrel fold metal-dependent hydrolase
VNEVLVPWKDEQTGFWWNETCAMVLDHFGLPGDRYTSHPAENNMTFKFINEQDALMCKILLSDRI